MQFLVCLDRCQVGEEVSQPCSSSRGHESHYHRGPRRRSAITCATDSFFGMRWCAVWHLHSRNDSGGLSTTGEETQPYFGCHSRRTTTQSLPLHSQHPDLRS